MTAAQPRPQNGLLNGFTRNDKIPTDSSVPYAKFSETGLDGPDQVLYTDVDTTTEANGRVQIRLTTDDGFNTSEPPLSVPGVLSRAAKDYPNLIALISRPDHTGKSTSYTYKEYEWQVRTVAKAFLNLGLERYHSVCILGFNSPEWFIADVAAIYAGGFATGIYTTNSAESCLHCAKNSRANIIVVEDAKQLEKILEIKKDLPLLKAIVQYEGVPQRKDVLSWQDVLDIGAKESDDKLDSLLKTIGANECCTLVYTSGTVGNPKAVMLSHDNLLQDAKGIAYAGQFTTGEEHIISFLPLSHVAAQVVDIFLMMTVKGTVHFANKDALKGTLLNTLIAVQPTAFLGVPRVWEKIYEKMQSVARSNGPIKTWIATWAKAQGLHYHMNKMNGVDYKHWGYLFAKWLVFNKIKAALGFSRCKLFYTAAAPLSTEIKKYFISIDIPVMEAYGMSECAGAHTISMLTKCRLGSIGPVLRGFETKLDNIGNNGEGEICMRGRHVFMGYLNTPDKTNEAKAKNGWLHTGDLGRLDSDGFLYITGRIKELIITAGGENIPSINIEQQVLSELPALSYAVLIGDQRKYLTMLVTLKTDLNTETGEPFDTLTSDTLKWATSIGSQAKTVTDIITTKDQLIYKEIQNAINRANLHAISNAQKVQKFRILPHDFSIPTGELGPTLKIKRNVVYKMYLNEIEEMYKEN